MKVLFDIVHPADVLFFYHPIQKLQAAGHSVMVVARDKDVTLDLLISFDIDHICISTSRKGILRMVGELLVRDYRMLKTTYRYRPDVMLGFGGVSISHVGKLLNIPSISFYDTETAPLQHMLTQPFITEMHVPECYSGKTPKGRTYYFKGLKDLSYLHPDNFIPNKEIAVGAGYDESQENFFLRIVAWNANHDIGMSGWDDNTLNDFVEFLSQKGKVHISSESTLPPHLSQYAYKGKVNHTHHLLAHCSLYIGESATMAGEAVLLGVPSICAADIKLGYTDTLEVHGLLRNITSVNFKSLLLAFNEMQATSAKDWQSRRTHFLSDKVNMTDYITDSVFKFTPIQR